jgi:hypothetical protein
LIHNVHYCGGGAQGRKEGWEVEVSWVGGRKGWVSAGETSESCPVRSKTLHRRRRKAKEDGWRKEKE